MDILQETREITKQTFLGHVFSTTDSGKAEIFNIVQYALIGIVPIIVLNKFIQKFIPEADTDKQSIELLMEIFLQIVVMFCGIVIIHRMITYLPTYSGFRYDPLNLPNVILGFLVIILSIQSKLGLKTNILYDRASDLWNGKSNTDAIKKKFVKKTVGFREPMVIQHSPSQADHFEEDEKTNLLPHPEPSTTRNSNNIIVEPRDNSDNDFSPQAANGLLGGGFGSLF